MDHRLAVIAVCVVLTGTMGGYALGGFATSGGSARAAQANWWSIEASAEDASAASPPSADVATDTGPKNYVCKGCGPTLAERRMESSYENYSPADSVADIPPYASPEPARKEVALALPDLGAGAKQ